MSIEDFSLLYSYLMKAYSKEVDDSQLMIWYDFFKNYKAIDFKNAIIQYINENTYPPTIADIKNNIIKQQDPQLSLKADDEWEKVRESVRTYGYMRETEALNSLEPITRSIVRRIGYQDICIADEYTRNNLRNAFIKSFESEKQDILRYSKSNNNQSEEMKQIEQRNKDVINRLAIGMVKRIDDEINN